MVGKNLKTVKPLHLATVSIAFMTIPTLLILFQQRFFQLDFTSANTQYAIWASTALGIVGSAIATAIFYILVKRAGGLFASLVTYGIPFIALFWGFLDNEKNHLASDNLPGNNISGCVVGEQTGGRNKEHGSRDK